MDFLFDNWEIIVAGIVAVFTAFKWISAIKYVTLAKETGDIYIKYQEGAENGVWEDSEYSALGKEVVEAIEAGKNAFQKTESGKVVLKKQ
jgi:hypothetical protein